ncbi:MAG: UDP-N-acetylmuramoyl-L-alanine--D-glutamate ligase [Cyclobacteriaceae bacterium]|nr:UDP-N-acetylmuramoyl-L-alanine--D-glutamate ligase [Cyclobacteriaceae bacterium]
MENDKRIVILGAGETGVGAALLAKAKGFVPFVSDAGKIKPRYKKILFENAISLEEGQHNEDFLLTADEVIKSPGIPDNIPILKKFREKNIPIISDIEFACRYTRARIIAITGTNGKTTTCLLTYFILKQSGLNVCLAGNIGISFAEKVIDDKYDYYVLEISSFQLDYIRDFRPDIAILLNITPDHLDRYDYDFQKYVKSKFRILKNMTAEDIFIYFEGDLVIRKYLDEHEVTPYKLGISLNKIPEISGFMNGKFLKFNLPIKPSREIKISMAQVSLKGPHNMVNAMAAIMVAKMLKVSDKKLKEALHSFENVPHRLEKIAEVKKILFVNDSKATNLDAAIKAISSFTRPIIWIVGGVDKGNNYEQIQDLVKGKVKKIICLGKNNKRIMDAFKNLFTDIRETRAMKKAVREAFEIADSGDVVLLSPACASFDLFKNYADRGEKFRKEVDKLVARLEKKTES